MPKREDQLFTRYVDPTGEMSNRELMVGTWYVRRRELFARIVTGLLFLWCIVSVGGSVLYLLFYAAEGYWNDVRMQEEEVSRSAVNLGVRTRLKAVPLQFGGIEVFEASKDRFTIVAMADNPNQNWISTVSYRFVYDGGTTTVQTAVIFPNESRPLPVFGGVFGAYPTNIQLEIVGQSWRRLSLRTVAKPETFVAERTNITVEETVIGDPPGTEILTGLRVQVTIRNKTAFGYTEMPGILELIRGGVAVGYTPLFLDRFFPGEARTVDVRIPGVSAPIDTVRFIPNVNLFDTRSYLSPGQI